MSEIKSYPAPSKIRYRLERVLLRRWFKRFTNFLTIIAIILVRAPFINSWAVFNKRRRNVVATSSQVVAGRRNVVAIKKWQL